MNILSILVPFVLITCDGVQAFSSTNFWRPTFFDDSENDNSLFGTVLMAASIIDASHDESGSQTTKIVDSKEDINATSNDISRGGRKEPASTDGNNNLLTEGSKSTLSSTLTYWSNSFRLFGSSVTSFMNRILPRFLRRKSALQSMPDWTSVTIEAVVVPNSTVLPSSVVRSVAQRSGLLGSTLSEQRIYECARALKKWYLQRGYILHSMKDLNLNFYNGTATLSVDEPLVSNVPVDIKFAKGVPIDPDTGETTTIRKYRKKWERSNGSTCLKGEWEKTVAQLNFTLVEATGRTNPKRISKRLSLVPGNHFKWDGDSWRNIAQSGIFSKVYAAEPFRTENGTVQFRVIAEEAPLRNLEYGISKSLYTGSFEGEIDFSHRNVFGGGEKVGVVVRRGTKDKEPSMKIRFSDDRFGAAGGYNVELFNDYLSTDNASDEVGSDASGGDSITENEAKENDEDSLLCRKGLTYCVSNPLSRMIQYSTSSASFEQTATRNGKHEFIGSASLDLGPFQSNLPLGARANLFTSMTSGGRITEHESGIVNTSNRLLPYSSVTVTTRQTFPLLRETYSTLDNKKAVLALQHSIFSSTQNLPRHEANAAGFAANVRGYTSSSHEPIRSSLTGATEIRIPVTIPFRKYIINQDASLVVFGDWMFALKRQGREKKSWKDVGYRQSSIGIGLRKTLQGIPVKYDFSYTENGRIGSSFGLGSDWDI